MGFESEAAYVPSQEISVRLERFKRLVKDRPHRSTSCCSSCGYVGDAVKWQGALVILECRRERTSGIVKQVRLHRCPTIGVGGRH